MYGLMRRGLTSQVVVDARFWDTVRGVQDVRDTGLVDAWSSGEAANMAKWLGPVSVRVGQDVHVVQTRPSMSVGIVGCVGQDAHLVALTTPIHARQKNCARQ